MELVYALESIPYNTRMVFLAGPTPRSSGIPSWRPGMIDSLNKLDFDLPRVSILIPEDRSGVFHGNYDHQTEWEYLAISSCDVLLIWVPRDIDGGMPAFTTNVEFGFWLREKTVVLGYPPQAEKMTYLEWLYGKVKRETPLHSMKDVALKVTNILRDL